MLVGIALSISMLVIGYLAWTTIQRQESGDEEFEAKLRADEERARAGRQAEAEAHHRSGRK